jgi:tRNA 2-thiocytidine biosynthesis protein TtcA
VDNLFKATMNVVPSHLMDRKLHPFETLQTTGVADAAGDRAFDDDEGCAVPAVPLPQVVMLQAMPHVS